MAVRGKHSRSSHCDTHMTTGAAEPIFTRVRWTWDVFGWIGINLALRAMSEPWETILGQSAYTIWAEDVKLPRYRSIEQSSRHNLVVYSISVHECPTLLARISRGFERGMAVSRAADAEIGISKPNSVPVGGASGFPTE